MNHDMWDRMMNRLLQEKKEVQIKSARKQGIKPDYLDLDKDGDKEEPLKNAAKELPAKKNKIDETLEELEEILKLSGSESNLYEEEDVEYLSEAEAKKKKPRLGKVVRNPSGSNKKFHVYVKCGGKVKKISFGDPGLSIKRDSPERRKNFRIGSWAL